MSLTTQLHGGPLAAWCAANLPGTERLAAEVTAAARRYRPVRPDGQVPAEHWAAIGGAFGQRLAFLVQQSPPYYALYGLVRAGIASRPWADVTASLFPTHAGLPVELAAKALELRPTPGGWADLGDPMGTAVLETPDEAVLSEFFARLLGYLRDHAPVGQLGGRGVEAGLARACAVLSGWEDAYRSATLPGELLALHERGGYTVEQLRAVIPEHHVTELVALAEQMRTTGALETLRRSAGDPPPEQPLGTAGPVIVNHWADGDLITGRTLWDVKTVVRVDHPDRLARWLWQLLAYAWLDTADTWGIRSVGLYLARHGALVSWPLTRFTATILGGRPEAAVREEFLTVAARAVAEEGAEPPGPWRPRPAAQAEEGTASPADAGHRRGLLPRLRRR
ncbi:hypothetical protein HFP15_40025 [Amycolatopsis sp. K13G38]|uniref:Uncharacterized protein n=1 Tax=Amycolatopsis acididurans TaxID=2724524 RepID=A0ABX1JJP2_9PSEU|nr:hypothetical protein [Amycolatopsis acididurans]NKQ59049.1 hypothetical protein [Amycolatopsis acididurans]